VIIICDQNTFEANRGMFDEVVVLSVPMGLPQAKYIVEMLTKVVVKTTLKPKAMVVEDESVTDEPVKKMSFDLPEDNPEVDAPKVKRKRTSRN
jgi:hypothetical protein